jgi:acid phosphatase (class A)
MLRCMRRPIRILVPLALSALLGCLGCVSPSSSPPSILSRIQAGKFAHYAGIGCRLPAPPAKGSDAEKADFSQLLEWQVKRTDADRERVAAEARVSLQAFLGAPYGPLSEKELQGYSELFEKVRWTADLAADGEKRRWARPRPFAADSRLHPCVQADASNPAYPSGHSTISAANAQVLALLWPSRSQEFFRRADQIGLDRVIAGVHHPSDIAAGKDCGTQVFEAIRGTPEFAADLAKARKALSLPGPGGTR